MNFYLVTLHFYSVTAFINPYYYIINNNTKEFNITCGANSVNTYRWNYYNSQGVYSYLNNNSFPNISVINTDNKSIVKFNNPSIFNTGKLNCITNNSYLTNLYTSLIYHKSIDIIKQNITAKISCIVLCSVENYNILWKNGSLNGLLVSNVPNDYITHNTITRNYNHIKIYKIISTITLSQPLYNNIRCYLSNKLYHALDFLLYNITISSDNTLYY